MAKLKVPQFGELHIPAWVVDHPSFLKWLRSGAVPEDVRVGYIDNEVWAQTMPERAFTHNKIKTLVARVLDGFVEENGLGVYFGDGMTFTSEEGGFTTVPDGIFLSQQSIDDGLVKLTGGKRSHHDTELVGTPDLIVEVVSDSTEYKDTEWLMANYWNAGISEYWVIDSRMEPLLFTIYRRGPKGYVGVRKSDGWSRSTVLGKSYRFVPQEEKMGFMTYRLEVR